MHQLIYTSDARPGLSNEDLSRIVEQSARNNPSGDITGFLLFQGGRFLQLIEGPLIAIEMLMAQLAQDERHRDLRVLSRVPIAQRSFPQWRMRCVEVEMTEERELERVLGTDRDGCQLPQAVREFLREKVGT